MVTGHLQQKKGHYYAVLNIRSETGQRSQKWIATGLEIKGNKKRAEAVLRSTIAEYEAARPQQESKSEDILFADYMLNWLEMMRGNLEDSTFTSYRHHVKKVIDPYFRNLGVSLNALQAKHIQGFYLYLLSERGNSPATVKRFHANIRKALQQAVKTEMIPTNPADKVDKPRQRHYAASFYDEASLNLLLEKARGTRHELAILVAACYGLRRSEVLGLRWDSIDFQSKTVSICHTVTSASDDHGHQYLVQKNRPKNRASHRMLPLIAQVEEALLSRRAQIESNAQLCGKGYCQAYSDYVFVNNLGSLIRPEYLSRGLQEIIERHGLRKIRFHDLRHSYASLLLKNGINMKAIQEWLGHSSYATTANIYAHLDYNAKIASAEKIAQLLPGPLAQI